MDRFIVETLDDRDAPAGGLLASNVAIEPMVVGKSSPATTLVFNARGPSGANVQPSFNHLASETKPPQAVIEGTDVGPDGGGGPIDYSYAVCED